MRRLIVAALLLVPLSLSAAPKVICIDPGHGGSDPGAVGCGLEEASVVLDVAWKLHALLDADPDFKPIMTRTADTYVSLQGRCNYANDNGANRFASLHCNAFNGSASGIETYAYTNGSATSFDQRNRIQDWMTETWPKLPDRGGKTAGYYVIKNTAMPATLSELAFIDKCSLDATYLADDTALQAAAIAHHQALRESLGLFAQPVDPTDPPVVPPDDGTGVIKGVVFQDQGVGTQDMSLRLPGAWVEAAGDNGAYEAMSTTSPYGEFMIPLPAGTYQLMVSLNGYYTNQRTCVVTSNQETWCSVGLFKKPGEQPPSLGTLQGVVYEDQGVGSSDTLVRLPGAKVLIDNGQGTADQIIAAAPDADWLFQVPPGFYTVTVVHDGHWTNTRSCDVQAGQTVWCSVGMFKQDQGAPPDAPPAGGILLGAVYEADDAGDADLSVRLPGARVEVEGAGLYFEAKAGQPYGLFSFALPAGTYTVTATLDGYWPNSRTCAVATGVEVWCSVGLLKDEGGYGGPDDPSTPAVTSEDPANMVPSQPGTTEADPNHPGQPLIVPQDPLVDDAGGCGTAQGNLAALFLLIALMGVLGMRRRWLWPLLAVFLVLPGALADEGPTLSASNLTRRIEGGAYPVVSPDGTAVAFTSPTLDLLSVWQEADGSLSDIAQGERVGYAPIWNQAGPGLAWRLPHQRRHEIPVQGQMIAGKTRFIPRNTPSGRWIRVIDEQVFLQTGTSLRRISSLGDRYYAAAFSADGRFVLFHGLSTGIYVHDVKAGQTHHLGAGTNGQFSADSTHLVWDHCLDDGDAITSCEISIAQLAAAPLTARTISGLPALARQPSLGPDKTLYFEYRGAIWSARLD